MGDQRPEAELDLRSYRSHCSQRDKGIDKGIVGALHPVRMKYEVIAYENGIEAQRFGFLGSFNQLVFTRVSTKMWEQQTIFRSNSCQICPLQLNQYGGGDETQSLFFGQRLGLFAMTRLADQFAIFEYKFSAHNRVNWQSLHLPARVG